MKKIFFLLFCICTFLCTNEVSAKKIVFYGTGDDIVHVLNLPYTEEYEIITDDNEVVHGNLGILHEQFTLFWIPIWNYGNEIYVLYNEDVEDYDIVYANLSKDDIKKLQRLYNISYKPELPFWDRIGGKLIMLLVLAIVIFFYSDEIL
ncbi:MAG: hypothetical protein K5860_11050 [Bacteroidales bacterium]|nr:hypothetical protein [Bacteroidales bacterium]